VTATRARHVSDMNMRSIAPSIFWIAVLCCLPVMGETAREKVEGRLRAAMPKGWLVGQIQEGRQSVIILKRETHLAEGEYRLLPVPCVSLSHGRPPITLTIRLYETKLISQQAWSDARDRGVLAAKQIPALLRKLVDVPTVKEPKPSPREYAKYKPRTKEEERLVAELKALTGERGRSRGLPHFWYEDVAFWSVVVALDAGNSHLPLGSAISIEAAALQAELSQVQSVLDAELKRYEGSR
jgi:hypothetical protein